MNSGAMNAAKLNDLGIAIGMNNKKNGCLKYLGLMGTISSNAIWNGFVNMMKISDFDHENMYGDKKIAKDM